MYIYILKNHAPSCNLTAGVPKNVSCPTKSAKSCCHHSTHWIVSGATRSLGRSQLGSAVPPEVPLIFLSPPRGNGGKGDMVSHGYAFSSKETKHIQLFNMPCGAISFDVDII